jgi:hypothetical protein
MVVMNDYILSADDVTKTNTVNPNAFSCPNYGPLGIMRDGLPIFFRESPFRHTASSEFNITNIVSLPKTEIIYSYAFASDVAINAIVDSGADGIVVAGVGHGNYNRAISKGLEKAFARGIMVVRSSRIAAGGVDQAPEECLTPMLLSGRGELLEPIEVPALEGISVKIETPNVFISTAEAYRGVVPEKPQIPLRELLKLPLDEWRDKIKNDFEKTLFAKYPQLDECKENFYRKGAVYASMSGSGSSVFGLFAK